MTKINKYGQETTKNISYRLQFIDRARFMASSLPNLVNNLFEEIHKIKYEYGRNDRKVELAELNINIATAFLNTQTLKMI